MSELFRVGPAKVFVADDLLTPYEDWTYLGTTRGDVIYSLDPGSLAFGRADQSGITPRADAVWKMGRRSSAVCPMTEPTIARMAELVPGSVQVTSGGASALGWGSKFAAVSPKAFAVVPETDVGDLTPWWESEFTCWIPKGVVQVVGDWTYSVPEGDDALAGAVLEVRIGSLGADQDISTLVRDAGGIGRLPDGMSSDLVAGSIGFGVAPYPETTLPSGFAAMTGSDEVGHDNYGNYLIGSSQSVMCWIPRFYYRVSNETAAPFFGTKVEISPYPAPGFALHRAFIDGGLVKKGFFVDKYLWSNALANGTDNTDVTGGIAASISGRRPVSTATANNPISFLTGNSQTPTATYGGVFSAAKSRGDDFAPLSIFVHSALAMLALAHAQALMDVGGSPVAGATTYAAWMDVAPYAPKGCNDDALGDAQDVAVSYTHSGYENPPLTPINQPLTGSGTPFAKTTHNGQACGVADLNGAMWEVVAGLTNIGGPTASTYYILQEAIALKDLLDATSGDLAAFSTTPYDLMDPVWWTDASATWYFGNGTNQVVGEEPVRSAPAYHLAACGIMQDADGGAAAQVATNSFGGDGFYRKHTNLLAPGVGGDWSGSSLAGVWALVVHTSRTSSLYFVGSRSVLYV